jgi:transcriptional regulator with XRE-family HTH domain
MLKTTSPTIRFAMAVITDKTYYQALGRRIAERRKELGITQVQLAEAIGVAQQTMAHYEAGALRVAVALLLPLTHTLDMTLEELVGEERKSTKGGRRGPAPKIQQQLELIGTLPKAKQRVIAQLIDSMLQSHA